MNKSKLALQITEDIYTFNSENEILKYNYHEHKIDKYQFATSQYLILCKIAYLIDVIKTLQRMGYKFAKYEKELHVLKGLKKEMIATFNKDNITEISIHEKFSLSSYLTKYDEVLSILDEIYEELQEKV